MIWALAALGAAVSISLLAVAVGTILDRLGRDYPATQDTVPASADDERANGERAA